MDLMILIASTDRTANIGWHSFRIDSVIGQQVSTCSFKVKVSPTKTWFPVVGDEVTVLDGATTIFGGVVVQSEQVIDGLLITYNIECKDWTQYLDRVLVLDKAYTGQTVNDIISDLNTDYLTGFTITNVGCTTVIPYIYFNKIKVSQCLQQLATQVGYNWYVDYSKDIHFFATNSETAPFGLTDTNGNYIFNSLTITDDISQLRNKIYVIQDPAAAVGDTSINCTADGSTFKYVDYIFWPYANSDNKPRPNTFGVYYGGNTYRVYHYETEYKGTLNINEVYWHSTGRYLEFNYAARPSNGANIQVTGKPTFYKEYVDTNSVNEYGEYMHSADDGITDLQTADQYAASMFAKYKDKQQKGTFKTYESGLKPGQIINIASAKRGITATDYIIQRVSLIMRSHADGEYVVDFATWRTVSLVNLLQKII
jgi:hypothetical protein